MALLAKLPIYLMRYTMLLVENPLKAFIYLALGMSIGLILYGLIWFKLEYPYWKMKRDLLKSSGITKKDKAYVHKFKVDFREDRKDMKR